MKVLVTGAGGNLGRVLLPALAAAGHEARAADFRPPEPPSGSEPRGSPGAPEIVELDVRDAEAVRRAAGGVEAIVHGAALHGVHVKTWPPHDFWWTNVTGTFNVYEAAREAGVRRVVLSSTMGVYGDSAQPRDGASAFVTEDLPARPNDVYGLSKHLCEELARYYARVHGIATWSLRLGMFVPETFERYGFRLLFGGVDDRDVAQAVLLALSREPAGGFDVVNVMAETPFEPDDARAMATDPGAVIERHWPGSSELLADHGLRVEDLMWGWALWPVDKAKRELGYSPRYGFGEFLEALRVGDTAHYPFAGLAQWGLDSYS